MSGNNILGYIILSLSIAYVFVYSSMDEINILSESKTKHQESLDMISNIDFRKNQLLEQYNKISDEDKKKINTVLPNSLNFVKLMSEMDAVASSQGIILDRISVTEIGSSGDSIADATIQKPYKSALIGFSFEADYGKFNVFMDLLEKSMRILDVRVMRIRPIEKGEYSFDIQLETYWLRS